MNQNSSYQQSTKEKLQLVRCECGEEILLLPDIGEMSQAIDSHAKEHALKENDPEKSMEIFENIQNTLAQKTLLIASNNK